MKAIEWELKHEEMQSKPLISNEFPAPEADPRQVYICQLLCTRADCSFISL